MRIAHIITRMVVGGAQENTLFTCLDLQDLFGDEVLLITGPALGPEGNLMGQGRGAEVKTMVVDSLRRNIHPWRDTRAYFDLKRELKRFQPDVVHTHSAKGGFLGRLAAHATGCKAIVHTVHGAPFHEFQNVVSRKLFQWCEWYAARRCHAMVSVADAMTDLMTSANIAPRDKFATVYSGMDVEPFARADENHRQQIRQELGYLDSDVVVGKIARLFHLKGHEYVLEASQRIVKECPNVRFLFIGDGILANNLKSRVEAIGSQKHFQFTGLVPPSDIPKYVAAMDMLVHASLREGLARALPQALIAGKPVVTYDVDGAREVAIPGETGYLLPPKSITPLEDAVIELATHETLRQQLGQEGRKRFTDQFRHEIMTRELRAIYNRLVIGEG